MYNKELVERGMQDYDHLVKLRDDIRRTMHTKAALEREKFTNLLFDKLKFMIYEKYISNKDNGIDQSVSLILYFVICDVYGISAEDGIDTHYYGVFRQFNYDNLVTQMENYINSFEVPKVDNVILDEPADERGMMLMLMSVPVFMIAELLLFYYFYIA